MQILILEPYFTGSHAAWAEELARHSRHEVRILSLPGTFWKWRMRGGAVTLADRFQEASLAPDLLLASSMLDLTTFLALTRRRTEGVPAAVYFHENQITYPWSPDDRDVRQGREAHYGFINYASALAADAVFFNSGYHVRAFFDALPGLLGPEPQPNTLDRLPSLRRKSRVLPLGLDLRRLDALHPPGAETAPDRPPLLLWNHRWEHDKNPGEFFEALFVLAGRGLPFEVAVLGECFAREPETFLRARDRLGDRVVQFGYVPAFAEYAGWLWRADILPVHSLQDFFGASVVQAMYCDCSPLLPDRLAYPEHIPAESRGSFFYADFEDLLERLQQRIQGPLRAAEASARRFVARYDWESLAPVYDDALEAVAEGRLPALDGCPQDRPF